MQVSRQKSQLLARFYRRPCQNNAAHLVIFKSGHRHGHGQIGLTSAGRPHAENNHIVPHGVHILLLAKGFRFDRLAVYGMTYTVAVHGKQQVLFLFAAKLYGVIHTLFLQNVSSFRQLQKLIDNACSPVCGFPCPGYPDCAVPIYNYHIQIIFNPLDMGVKLPEKILHVLHRHINTDCKRFHSPPLYTAAVTAPAPLLIHRMGEQAQWP